MPLPGENIQSWSTVAADNSGTDALINWAEGMPRADVNNSARSMMAAHAKQRNLGNGSIVTTGSANAQAFLSGIGFTSVPTGLRVLLKIGAGLTNTDTVTLNMDAIGDIVIKTIFGEDLSGDEIRENGYCEFIYNGTNWILLRTATSEIITTVILQTILTETITTTTTNIIFGPDTITDAYDTFEFEYYIFNNTGSTAALGIRCSLDGGATFIAGVNGYHWSGAFATATGAGTITGQMGTYLALSALQDPRVPQIPISGFMRIYRPWSTFISPITNQTTGWQSSFGMVTWCGGGACTSSGPITNIAFMWSNGGNFIADDGFIKVKGIK